MQATVSPSQRATRALAQYWEPQTYWHKPRDDTPRPALRHTDTIAPPAAQPPPDVFTAQVHPANLGLIDSLLLNAAYYRALSDRAEVYGPPPPYIAEENPQAERNPPNSLGKSEL